MAKKYTDNTLMMFVVLLFAGIVLEKKKLSCAGGCSTEQMRLRYALILIDGGIMALFMKDARDLLKTRDLFKNSYKLAMGLLLAFVLFGSSVRIYGNIQDLQQ